MSVIRIEMPKGMEQGQTSASPTSPTTSTATSPRSSAKNQALIAGGLLVGKQALNIFTNEIKAGGNEELANTINNITTGVALSSAIIYTGGTAAIPIAISGAAQMVERQLTINRENKHKAHERQMMGSRQTYNMGVGYE
jgi:hypothetical protein